MKLTTTGKKSKYVNMLIYGVYGIGKTPLSATAPKPIIIDIDEGTLSIADQDLPVLETRSIEDLEEAYEFCKGKKGKQFDTIILDSGYELVDVVLAHLFEQQEEDKKDGIKSDKRQAYWTVAAETKKWIRKFRDLPFHFVCTSLADVIELDDIEKYRVSFPGNVLKREIPGMFDEVFCIRYEDPEDDESKIVLQCKRCVDYDARDRSKKLKKFEKLDLTAIIAKIQKKVKK